MPTALDIANYQKQAVKMIREARTLVTEEEQSSTEIAAYFPFPF